MLSIFLGVCLVISLLYIHRLRIQLHGYERVWEQIESVADRNQDGTFTIDVRHLEHVQPEPSDSMEHSGARLIGDGHAIPNPNKAA